MKKLLFFDTETSALPPKGMPYDHKDHPWTVQLAWMTVSEEGHLGSEVSLLVQPDGRDISEGAARVHQITTERAQILGLPQVDVATLFMHDMNAADLMIAHNYDFDLRLVSNLLVTAGFKQAVLNLLQKESYCLMKKTTAFCKLPGKYGFKWPKLEELHGILFGTGIENAHDALVDVRASVRCYFEYMKRLSATSTTSSTTP